MMKMLLLKQRHFLSLRQISSILSVVIFVKLSSFFPHYFAKQMRSNSEQHIIEALNSLKSDVCLSLSGWWTGIKILPFVLLYANVNDIFLFVFSKYLYRNAFHYIYWFLFLSNFLKTVFHSDYFCRFFWILYMSNHIYLQIKCFLSLFSLLILLQPPMVAKTSRYYLIEVVPVSSLIFLSLKNQF